jgi:hypothetical protein
MSKTVRWWAAGAAVLAVGGLLYVAGAGVAGGGGGVKGDVAKKLESVEEVMDLFKTKKKGGYPITGFKDTEGIESVLRVLGRDGPKNAAKDAPMVEEMGYVTAAIAEIAHAKAPTKDQGKKLRKDWLQWSKDMEEGALELSKAAQGTGASAVKTAAAKVNASCNNCHAVYRQ